MRRGFLQPSFNDSSEEAFLFDITDMGAFGGAISIGAVLTCVAVVDGEIVSIGLSPSGIGIKSKPSPNAPSGKTP